MAHDWSATTTINRPIDQVFAFLADGTNDTKFSPRHGFGKVILPLALRGAKKDADALAGRIKAAAEAS
jgi:hypothetical protein